MLTQREQEVGKKDPTSRGCLRAIFLLMAVLVGATTLSWYVYEIDRGMEKRKEDSFYPDLTSGWGYACSEVSSFVSEFDPFYKWAMGSSLPTILQQSLGSSSASDLELANTAYQKSSSWRVLSNTTDNSSNATKLYASADPHVAGGEFKQHRHNWVWRMKTSWGISMRMCLSYGNDGNNRSCLWTTPIISTTEEDLSLLFIGIPYRFPSAANVTPDLTNFNYTESGKYLSNYASNARTDFFSTRQKLNDEHYYITERIPKCKFAPSYYASDAMSYLAFPGLQCGCNGTVCVVATQNVDNTKWGLIDYRVPCDGLKSYWAWNTGGITGFTLVAFNSSSNTSVPILVTFPDDRFDSHISSISAGSVLLMQNITSCVESSLAQESLSPDELVSKCSTGNVTLDPSSGQKVIGGLQSSRVWFTDPPRQEKDTTCLNDLPQGQLRFNDTICVSKLDAATSSELKAKIKSLTQLTDIRFKQNKAWKNVADTRHSIYLAMFTGIVSVLGSWAAVISHRLMDIEKQLDEYTSRHQNSESWWERWIAFAFKWLGKVWIKFSYRAGVMFGSSFAALYGVFDGTRGGIKEEDLVQAQTVAMSMNQGSTILVTTTATYEVAAIWTAFIIFCVFTFIVIVASLCWVAHMLEKDKLKDDPYTGGSSRISLNETNENPYVRFAS